MSDETAKSEATAAKAEAKAEAEETTPSLLPSDEAVKAQADDDDWRKEHPNEPRTREPIEGVGGESFTYLEHTTG